MKQREIKFRAWEDESEVMRYSNDMHLAEFFNYCEGWKIMQYTGLKDKNGKEIYEGDIIELGVEKKPAFFIYEVMWDFLGFNFRRKGTSNIIFPFKDDLGIYEWKKNFLQVEVIGNIYENPELLKVKNV